LNRISVSELVTQALGFSPNSDERLPTFSVIGSKRIFALKGGGYDTANNRRIMCRLLAVAKLKRAAIYSVPPPEPVEPVIVVVVGVVVVDCTVVVPVVVGVVVVDCTVVVPVVVVVGEFGSGLGLQTFQLRLETWKLTSPAVVTGQPRGLAGLTTGVYVVPATV
jgi:hypothetical protein